MAIHTFSSFLSWFLLYGEACKLYRGSSRPNTDHTYYLYSYINVWVDYITIHTFFLPFFIAFSLTECHATIFFILFQIKPLLRLSLYYRINVFVHYKARFTLFYLFPVAYLTCQLELSFSVHFRLNSAIYTHSISTACIIQAQGPVWRRWEPRPRVTWAYTSLHYSVVLCSVRVNDKSVR